MTKARRAFRLWIAVNVLLVIALVRGGGRPEANLWEGWRY